MKSAWSNFFPVSGALLYSPLSPPASLQNGFSKSSFVIPSMPTLKNAEIFFQSLLIPLGPTRDMRFTNAYKDTIY